MTADLPIASTLITLVSADGVSLASNDASPGSEDTLIAPISTWADAEYASWYSKTFVATIEVTYVDGARRRSVVASARGSGRGRFRFHRRVDMSRLRVMLILIRIGFSIVSRFSLGFELGARR